MASNLLLINTNVTQPPVSPVGLEYVGEALVRAGVPVQVLDLAFETDWKAALKRALNSSEPLAVAMSVRNTDDCCFATRKSFLPWLREVVSEVRQLSQAFILLGGVGFSVMPEATLAFTGADAGIAGDGEEAVPSLVRRLANDEDISQLPNLVYQSRQGIICNPKVDVDLRQLPASRRELFDNRKYEQLGAMVGIETKRGCSNKCIFCADPVARGHNLRLHSPDTVAQEFQHLFDRGVSWFHLCDSEFNLPMGHAREVCQALIEAGLGEKVRWYTYCSPTPFDRELANLMKRAGCAGINFGIDSLCDEQLKRLGQSHTADDIGNLVSILKEAGLNYIFDLLVGGPGETEDTVKTTVARVKKLDIPLAGISVGVRVYPRTSLSQSIAGGSVTGNLYPPVDYELWEPLFYLSAHLGDNAAVLVDELVAGDPRFLVLSAPAEKGSYNYADDNVLGRLIKEGARGAYWDIIRQNRPG